MYQFYFEKLEVWKNSRDLYYEIHELTKKFPVDEKMGLTSQIRRASVSISLNLSEGSTRNTRKDQAKFTSVAYGSLMELLNLLIFCNHLSYINDHTYLRLREKTEILASQLNALRKAQQT